MARKPTLKKVLMTINNPSEHGLDWKEFKFRLNLLPTFRYLVLSEEKGVKEKTTHYHAYIHLKTGVSFDRLKQLFPSVHLDFVNGTDLDNANYVKKKGSKWEGSEKADEEHHLRDEEYGEIVENYTSEERSKIKPDTSEVFANIYTMASSGMTPLQIVEEMPSAIKYLYQVEKLCKMYEVKQRQDENARIARELEERERKRNAETVEAFNALCAEIGVGGVCRD